MTMVICAGQIVHLPNIAAHSCSVLPPRPHRKKAIGPKGGDEYNLLYAIPTGKTVSLQFPLLPSSMKKEVWLIPSWYTCPNNGYNTL